MYHGIHLRYYVFALKITPDLQPLGSIAVPSSLVTFTGVQKA